jgi:uncharacterized protein YbbC (DUF1343 family)/CubicO group peptidase (beta-lactamase class C family)
MKNVRSFLGSSFLLSTMVFAIPFAATNLAGALPKLDMVAAPAKALPIFRADKLSEMDNVIRQAIADKKCPGGVLWFEHGGYAYHKAYGNRALVPETEKMTEDTIFDAASLTKVAAGTPAMMLAIERGLVNLDAPVSKYIPEFAGNGKENVTVRHLLTHTSGLRGDIETRSDWKGQEVAIQKACEEKLLYAPGTDLKYSDINLFLVGEIVQRVTHRKLEEFVANEIYKPLRMADSGYLPPAEKVPRIAPTEVENGKPYRGVVHDPTARHMGGVAGHAGLFTTAADLARYARMLLNMGELDGVRIFKPETVKLMTSVQTPPALNSRRGLGWDIASSYSGPRGKIFPVGSYGHTGWTGTSIWIDPFSQTFLIFLSNRNHPDESGNVGLVRSKLATLAGEAISDYNFAYVPGALDKQEEQTSRPASGGAFKPALNGIDVLKREKFARLKGLRLGLVTNHTGVDRERNSTIDLLKNAPGVQLKALFSPEHGIRGALDEKVGDGVDEKTGLPVYSLYGKRLVPTPEQLKDLDALVFDIQDIGCRFYTYTATLGLCLEAAAKAHIKYIVLDRVEPINATSIEGPVVDGTNNFVAYHSRPLRYAMTPGELAKMYNSERKFSADLVIVPIENWTRDQWFDETGLPWVNQSPNMRNLTEATLYPGIGLHESALSVGRGTDTPFEVVGAPYINEVWLAEQLNSAGLEGIRFVPIRFTPTASTFKDKECGGVYLVVTDRNRLNSVDVGIELARILFKKYPNDFAIQKMHPLVLENATIEDIKANKPLSEIKRRWAHDLLTFKMRREPFLMYK